MKRTHTCGELKKSDVNSSSDSSKNSSIILQGWVHTRRDHGGVIFIDLRDRYGLTQVVFEPENKVMFQEAEKLRREDCIQVTGIIKDRPEGMKNPKMPTGEIEIIVTELKIFNKSLTPPIEIDENIDTNEEIRHRYRYLDLRRHSVQELFIFRSKAAQVARKFLTEQGFLEIETPLLVKPTPEGARDYIVPSRVNIGKVYALPQSPQLYKQILMCSGFDKYFQIARCLRDEDLRSDRQPEHTQIDVEMSFPELDDIYETMEGLLTAIFKETLNIDLPTHFQRIPFAESMDKYGTDKPDIRYEMFLHNVSDIVKESDFGVFKDVVTSGGIVKCVVCPEDLTRKDIDSLITFSQHNGAKGMAWMRITEKGLESNIVKFFSEDIQKKLLDAIGNPKKGIVMFIADTQKMTNQVLDKLRRELAQRLDLLNPKEFKFAWITEFPLFDWNEEEDRWDPAHHLFCMPKEEHIQFLETDPGKVYCTQFDLILNGTEMCSGSIRINNPDLQERVMKVIGLKSEDLEEKFGFLLEAFRYGAPPHGGFGLGFDRLIAMMNGLSDIREVIAFPKNKAAQCLMDGSPGLLTDIQGKELHIKFIDVKK